LKEAWGGNLGYSTIEYLLKIAGCIHAPEGSIGEIDENTVAYHFYELFGVGG
jgi:aldehyde dehydrogenase